MILHRPFQISPRLLPALQIGGAWIQLEYAGVEDNRMVFRWTIDLPNGSEYSGAYLKSGCQGATLQEMFGNLLAFLGAAAESYRYRIATGRTGENEDLFPAPVVEWAHQFSGDISALEFEIEESGQALIEE